MTLFKFESIQYFSLFEQFSLSVLEANFALLKKLVFFVLNRLLAASLYSPYVNSIGIFEGKLNLEYACFVPFEENSLCTPCLLHPSYPCVY